MSNVKRIVCFFYFKEKLQSQSPGLAVTYMDIK